MTLAYLLRETLETDSQDVWEKEHTPTPVRRFGVRRHTAGLSIRGTVAILDLLGLIALTVRSGTGFIRCLKHRGTRRRRSRCGLRSTKNKLRLTAKRSGCTPLSTLNPNCSSKSTHSAAAGLTPWRRSCIGSFRNTMSQIQSFWLVLAAI